MELKINKKGIKGPNWVGAFIRQKREEKGLSQKELGQLFTPPVTTQFVSNLERGVTPVPATHVQAVVKALNLNEQELMLLMEKEYAAKLTSKIAGQNFEGQALMSAPSVIVVAQADEEFFKEIVHWYNQLGDSDRQMFRAQTKSWFESHLKKAI